MKKRYIFPAVLTQEKDNIIIEFPDIPECFTFAEDTPDILQSAKEVLELCISERKRKGIEIPEPTDIFSDKFKNKIIICVGVSV